MWPESLQAAVSSSIATWDLDKISVVQNLIPSAIDAVVPRTEDAHLLWLGKVHLTPQFQNRGNGTKTPITFQNKRMYWGPNSNSRACGGTLHIQTAMVTKAKMAGETASNVRVCPAQEISTNLTNDPKKGLKNT